MNNIQKIDKTVIEFISNLSLILISYVIHFVDSILLFFVVFATAMMFIIHGIFPIKSLKRAKDGMVQFLINK